MTNCIHENMTNSNEEIMKKRTIDFSCIAAITFYQYLILSRSGDTPQALLTIHDNVPVEFSPTPLGADAEIEGDDFGDYLQDLRINEPELNAAIAHDIALLGIDYTDIKFVKFNSVQIPVDKIGRDSDISNSIGSINDNYGDLLNYKEETMMYSLHSLWDYFVRSCLSNC